MTDLIPFPAMPEEEDPQTLSRETLLAQAQELLRDIDGVQLLGAQEAPHILNLAVPGVRSQGLINALQERDIYVSAGSACSKATAAMCWRPWALTPHGSTAPSASRSPMRRRRTTSAHWPRPCPPC